MYPCSIIYKDEQVQTTHWAYIFNNSLLDSQLLQFLYYSDVQNYILKGDTTIQHLFEGIYIYLYLMLIKTL